MISQLTARGPTMEKLEAFSKTAAILLIGLYVLGFIIVSLRNGAYGFAELNPLRPKILSAGVLFLFMTLLPAYVAHGIFSHDLELSPEQSFSRAIVGALYYYIACAILMLFLTPLYSLPPTETKTQEVQPSSLEYWLYIGAFWAVLFLIPHGTELLWKKFRTNPMLTALIAGSVVIFLVSRNLSSAGARSISSVLLWFFIAGVMSAALGHKFRNPEEGEQLNHLELLMIAMFAVGVFSVWIYPQFKPSWGGGSPVPVVIYFSHDSRLLPGQQLDAELLDESEGGFYIAERGHTQAIFVPRAAVATLYFSEKPLDSKLLGKISIEPTK
jgi:hypothetical protein